MHIRFAYPDAGFSPEPGRCQSLSRAFPHALKLRPQVGTIARYVPTFMVRPAFSERPDARVALSFPGNEGHPKRTRRTPWHFGTEGCRFESCRACFLNSYVAGTSGDATSGLKSPTSPSPPTYAPTNSDFCKRPACPYPLGGGTEGEGLLGAGAAMGSSTTGAGGFGSGFVDGTHHLVLAREAAVPMDRGVHVLAALVHMHDDPIHEATRNRLAILGSRLCPVPK